MILWVSILVSKARITALSASVAWVRILFSVFRPEVPCDAALVAMPAARRSGRTIWSAYAAVGDSKARTPRAFSAALRSESILFISRGREFQRPRGDS